MAYTYEELLKLAATGDPLIDPEHPEKASITDEGLVILGSNKDGYAGDLRIQIDGELSRVWFRDPSDLDPSEVFFGSEWTFEAVFTQYDDLVGWVYTW